MRQALPMVLLPGNLLDALPSLQERESSACPAPSPPGHLPQNFPKQQLSWCSAAFMCCSVRCGQKKRHRTSSGKQSPSCLQILETGGAAHEEGHMRKYQHLLFNDGGKDQKPRNTWNAALGAEKDKQRFYVRASRGSSALSTSCFRSVISMSDFWSPEL